MEASGGDDAVGIVVYIDSNDGAVTFSVVDVTLLAERQQQIFTQAPVEEGSGGRVNADYLEICEFTNLSERGLGSGDESVFGVVIDETLDFRADSHLGHDITSGHEDFIMLSTIEVNTVVALFQYGEGVVFSDIGHVVFVKF